MFVVTSTAVGPFKLGMSIEEARVHSRSTIEPRHQHRLGLDLAYLAEEQITLDFEHRRLVSMDVGSPGVATIGDHAPFDPVAMPISEVIDRMSKEDVGVHHIELDVVVLDNGIRLWVVDDAVLSFGIDGGSDV